MTGEKHEPKSRAEREAIERANARGLCGRTTRETAGAVGSDGTVCDLIGPCARVMGHRGECLLARRVAGTFFEFPRAALPPARAVRHTTLRCRLPFNVTKGETWHMGDTTYRVLDFDEEVALVLAEREKPR